MTSANEVIKYEGKVYSLVFLNTDSKLPLEDRLEICIGAIELEHSNKQNKMKIKGKSFEGEITHKGHYGFGAFYGNVYGARIETDYGKRDISLMITGKYDESLN